MTNPQHEALVEAVARALYQASCALDPIEPCEPHWGRGGYKTMIAYWHGLAVAALSATAATPSDEEVRLRAALREIIIRNQTRSWTATHDNPETHWVITDGEYARLARAALEPQGKDL